MNHKQISILLLTVLILVFASQGVAASGLEDRVAAETAAVRDELTYDELTGSTEEVNSPIANRYFAPVGQSAAALHAFEGTLTVEAQKMQMTLLDGSTAYFDYQFPGFSADFITVDGDLVPAQRDLIKDSPGRWELLLSPGKVWSEPSDNGMSRAAFPFVMIPYNRWFSYNGLATFLYDNTSVSEFRFQIVQEATPTEARFDAWAQFPMSYSPGEIPDRADLIASYREEVARRLPVQPWSELEKRAEPVTLALLTGDIPEEENAAAAVLIDGVLYRQPSMTRYGEFPYPDTMRHSVYSMSKSMGAAVGLLRLAEKYGPEVFNLKIADYLEVTSNHDGWAEVTFADALNMATGIGDVAPDAYPLNIDAETDTPKDRAFWLAETAQKKLDVAFSFGNYPWGPGEIARYTDRNTFVLSAAMDSYLKSQEGQDAHLWQMISEEVFEPIGVYHMPMIHTRERDGQPGIPFMGVGAYPTVDDAAKIAQLFQDGGQYEGQQLLHLEKTLEALYRTDRTGLPTGKSFMSGNQAYNLSFWGLPHGADNGHYYLVPFMSGWGGNTIFIGPNGVSTFVFTDYGPDSYSLAIPQFMEELQPYPDDIPAVSPTPGFALVMKGVWLIPENRQRVLLVNYLLVGWIGLVVGSLLLLLVHMVKKRQLGWGRAIQWTLLTLVIGPVGLLIYWRRVARRQPASQQAKLAISS